MDLDHERIALGCVVGVSGAAVAAGTSRERNQQIKLGKNSMKSPRRNWNCSTTRSSGCDHPQLRRFVAWVRRKPPEFWVRTRSAR
jgi:hypothetical protein